jgi:hypothetical protein
MISTFGTFATAKTNWATFFVNISSNNVSAARRVASWTLQNSAASQNLASTVVCRLNNGLTLTTEWSFWRVAGPWHAFEIAWAAAFFTGNNVGNLLAFTFSASWFFNGWAFKSLVIGGTS